MIDVTEPSVLVKSALAPVILWILTVYGLGLAFCYDGLAQTVGLGLACLPLVLVGHAVRTSLQRFR
jgi:membrane-bound ClpP family serine protease